MIGWLALRRRRIVIVAVCCVCLGFLLAVTQAPIWLAMLVSWPLIAVSVAFTVLTTDDWWELYDEAKSQLKEGR